MKKIISNSRFLATMFVAIVSLFYVQSFAQTCCLVDTLIINTGYDLSGGTIGVSANDPKWQVVALSVGCASLAPTTIYPYQAIRNPPSAWLANPAGQPGGYISFLNATGFPTIASADPNTYT